MTCTFAATNNISYHCPLISVKHNDTVLTVNPMRMTNHVYNTIFLSFIEVCHPVFEIKDFISFHSDVSQLALALSLVVDSEGAEEDVCCFFGNSCSI